MIEIVGPFGRYLVAEDMVTWRDDPEDRVAFERILTSSGVLEIVLPHDETGRLHPHWRPKRKSHAADAEPLSPGLERS